MWPLITGNHNPIIYDSVSMDSIWWWTLIDSLANSMQSFYAFLLHKTVTGPDHARSSTELSSWHSSLISMSCTLHLCEHLFFLLAPSGLFLESRLDSDLDPLLFDPLLLDLHTVLKWFFLPHLSQVLPNAGQFLFPLNCGCIHSNHISSLYDHPWNFFLWLQQTPHLDLQYPALSLLKLRLYFPGLIQGSDRIVCLFYLTMEMVLVLFIVDPKYELVFEQFICIIMILTLRQGQSELRHVSIACLTGSLFQVSKFKSYQCLVQLWPENSLKSLKYFLSIVNFNINWCKYLGSLST